MFHYTRGLKKDLLNVGAFFSFFNRDMFCQSISLSWVNNDDDDTNVANVRPLTRMFLHPVGLEISGAVEGEAAVAATPRLLFGVDDLVLLQVPLRAEHLSAMAATENFGIGNISFAFGDSIGFCFVVIIVIFFVAYIYCVEIFFGVIFGAGLCGFGLLRDRFGRQTFL